MLIEELQQLGANPWSWLVVGCIAIFAVHSTALLFLCPYSHGRATISDRDMADARDTRFRAGPRFALTMIGGILMTLAGLFMIAKGLSPALALGLLVTGIFVIQTEPVRLEAREYKTRVIANRDADPEVVTGSRDRLKASHRVLASTNLALLAAVTAGLLAF